jgi:DNA-binding winged helix-turn-helix (wHTH) protein/Tol biopolymer transport system component
MADRYSFGAFVLDTGTRELHRGDLVIPLTPKAFDLLQVLVVSGGVALEKQWLLTAVWPDSFVSEETLTQNIATLRKALGDLAERPQYIVTVPRHGYRFAAAVQVVTANSDTPAAEQPTTLRRYVRLTPAAVFSVAVLLTAAGVMAALRARPVPSPALLRFEIAPPPGTVFNASASHPAVSPDGRTIAFLAGRPGEEPRIWVRTLDSLTARELAGTAGAFGPFWSPDSRYLGFFAKGLLKKIGVAGEPPQVLCEALAGRVLGGTWHSSGVILFGGPDGIYRTSANGGGAARVTTTSSNAGENAHVLPQFLPDGRHFLYTSRLAGEGSYDSWIVLRSLDAADDRRLFSAASQAAYAGGDEMLFLRDGTLRVQRFDIDRLALKGDPVVVAGLDSIGANPASPRGMFGVSRDAANPVLAYRAAPGAELAWFDRRGTPLGRLGEIADRTPAISHDGTRVAITRVDNARDTRSIWILDVEHAGVSSQFTTGRWDVCPAWSPDDRTIVFASAVPNENEIFVKTVEASVAQAAPQHAHGCPIEWSGDGRYVLYAASVNATSRASGLWLLLMVRPDPARPLDGTSPIGPRSPQGRLSPDGRWLAYETDGSGRREISVRAFPDGARVSQVSINGGIEPQWSANGKELFFLGSDKRLMSAPVQTAGEFRAGTPVALFETELDPYGIPINGRNQYVAAPDGQRFLLKQSRRDALPEPITVVVNWRSLLK